MGFVVLFTDSEESRWCAGNFEIQQQNSFNDKLLFYDQKKKAFEKQKKQPPKTGLLLKIIGALQPLDLDIPEPYFVAVVLQGNVAGFERAKAGHVFEFADGNHFGPVLIPHGG